MTFIEYIEFGKRKNMHYVFVNTEFPMEIVENIFQIIEKQMMMANYLLYRQLDVAYSCFEIIFLFRKNILVKNDK